MKRLNYYQVHKNKKPKKLKEKITSKRMMESAIISMEGFIQLSIIASQHFNSLSVKTLAMFESIKNTSEALSNLHKFNHTQ